MTDPWRQYLSVWPSARTTRMNTTWPIAKASASFLPSVQAIPVTWRVSLTDRWSVSRLELRRISMKADSPYSNKECISIWPSQMTTIAKILSHPGYGGSRHPLRLSPSMFVSFRWSTRWAVHQWFAIQFPKRKQSRSLPIRRRRRRRDAHTRWVVASVTRRRMSPRTENHHRARTFPVGLPRREQESLVDRELNVESQERVPMRYRATP